MKTVNVTANEAGQIFFPNAKPGKDGQIYGYVRIQSEEVDLENAIGRLVTKSMLKQFSAKAANTLKAGQEFPGQLIHKDTLEPQYEGHNPLQVPVRNADGSIKLDAEKNPVLRNVTSNGMPVYRTTSFTKNQEASDSKLVYDKVVAEAPVPLG